VPTVSRSRLIPAPADRVWSLVSDPHNLPRWWPETIRVEDVHGEPGTKRSRFTQVLETSKGKPVRADFRCTASTTGRRIVWEQELEGTPFEGFLQEAELEVLVESSPESGATEVTIEGRRKLRGFSRFGSPMMRRATGQTLRSALDGIEQALVRAPAAA
jgi:uncharacterized protein YndB with AHSA1/START domain